MSSAPLLNINSQGGREVPVLTVCNLLLSLTYYPLSPGSVGMETSAKPFPCFQPNAGVDRSHSSGPKPDQLPLPLPAEPCLSQPPASPPGSLVLLGMRWRAEERDLAVLTGSPCVGPKTWSQSDGDNSQTRSERNRVSPFVCLFTRVMM